MLLDLLRLDPRPDRRARRHGLAGDDVDEGDGDGAGLVGRTVAIDGQGVRTPRRAHAQDVGRGAVGEPVSYDDPLAHDVRPEAVLAHWLGF